MRQDEPTEINRRRVFYIPGYDPFPARRYRELYRKEGAAQGAISGYEIAVSRRKDSGPHGWHVESRMDGQVVKAEVEVLVWRDLVRASMDPGIVATYFQLVHTAWIYISTGALFRLMRLRKGPIIAALYPIVMLLGQLVFALLMGWVAATQLDRAFDIPAILGWVIGAGLTGFLLHWFKQKDGLIYAHYLMHDYAYTAQSRGANPAELEARMTAFRDTIRAAMLSGTDEVLVVGHSSGAHLAISILADLLREGLPEHRPVLSLLTLGQVVPMVSFLPRADRLRADLHYLAAREELTWVDVTAPGDGCAFALCDPVAVTGVAPEGKVWPLVMSAAFTQTLSPETWKAMRWRFFRLHFQYLCAFDRPGDYDYFRITAGPVTLGARYGGRAPSKSLIASAESGYRSMAA